MYVCMYVCMKCLPIGGPVLHVKHKSNRWFLSRKSRFGNTIDHTKDEIITIAAHPADPWGEGDGNGPGISSYGELI